MKKLKKVIALSMSIVLSAGVVAGCSNGKNSAKNNDGNIKVTIGYWPDQETDPHQYEVYEEYRQQMNEKYPNIEIIPDQFNYQPDTVLTVGASGQLPNLYRVPYTEPKKMIEAGFAKDITELFKKNGYDKAITPAILNLIEDDGKYYGIPYSGYVLGLMCNMELFRQAGLANEDDSPKAPKTFEELIQTAKTIKEKTGQAGFAIPTSGTEGGWIFANLAWNFGVKFMDKVDGKWKATFNTPEAVEAFQYLSDLKWKYNVLPDNILMSMEDSLKTVAVNQAGMTLSAEDRFSSIVKNYKTPIDSIAYSSIPEGPGGNYALMGGDIWMMSAETTDEQADAILKWLEIKGDVAELTEEKSENLKKSLQAKVEQGLPVFRPSFNIWVDKKRIDAENEIYNKYTNVPASHIANIAENVTPKEEEPINAQQLYSALSSVMQEVLNNKNADIQSILDKANSSFQKDFLDNAQ